MEHVKYGRMKIGHFEHKSKKELEWWYSTIIEYLKEKNMIQTPNCSYALFIKEKFPHVWEKYILSNSSKSSSNSSFSISKLK